jgi:hypothetical protein
MLLVLVFCNPISPGVDISFFEEALVPHDRLGIAKLFERMSARHLGISHNDRYVFALLEASQVQLSSRIELALVESTHTLVIAMSASHEVPPEVVSGEHRKLLPVPRQDIVAV